MKRFLCVGLLAILAMSCTTQTNLSPQADNSSSQTPTSTVDQATSQTAYTNEKFGFSFSYPEGYVVDASSENQLPSSDESLQSVIEIWKQADYEAIQSANFEGGEYPPNINIRVYNNVEQLPLEDWKEELSHDDDRALTVAGQDAIAYTSTGLYESDNVVLSSPDGQVIRLSVGYIDASDPMRQVFQEVVSSFTFE